MHVARTSGEGCNKDKERRLGDSLMAFIRGAPSWFRACRRVISTSAIPFALSLSKGDFQPENPWCRYPPSRECPLILRQAQDERTWSLWRCVHLPLLSLARHPVLAGVRSSELKSGANQEISTSAMVSNVAVVYNMATL